MRRSLTRLEVREQRVLLRIEDRHWHHVEVRPQQPAPGPSRSSQGKTVSRCDGAPSAPKPSPTRLKRPGRAWPERLACGRVHSSVPGTRRSAHRRRFYSRNNSEQRRGGQRSMSAAVEGPNRENSCARGGAAAMTTHRKTGKRSSRPAACAAATWSARGYCIALGTEEYHDLGDYEGYHQPVLWADGWLGSAGKCRAPWAKPRIRESWGS